MPRRSIVSPHDQKVTFVELFFDLVFVFSVTQVVRILHAHPGLAAVGQTVLVFWLVWWAWTQFTWALNAADTTHPRIQVATLFATAIAFFMAIALPGAFEDRAVWFAAAYVLVRLTGLAVYAWVASANAALRAPLRAFGLVSLTGLVAVMVGAFLPGPGQYLGWGLAIALDVVAAGIGGRLAGWNLNAEHFAERHGLFVIIALGEGMIVAASGIAGGPPTWDLIVAAILSVAATCALWWTYFTRAKPALDRALEASQGAERSKMGRDVFSLLHFPMLCGVIAFAAAVEEAVHHPERPLDLFGRANLAGGVLLFVGGMVVATWRATGRVLGTRTIVSLITAGAVLGIERVPLGVTFGIAALGAVVVAAMEHRRGPLLGLASLVVFVAGCAEAPPATRVQWLFGSGQPEFDATAPPEFRRAALERLLTRALVEEDSAGRVVPGAARSVEVSADSLTYTITLRPGLRFTDDTPCTSEDFVRAWREGLERRDHQTWAWALSSVKGMKRYRAGRPPADLGLATPDEHTITIRLDQRDPLLLTRLAVPGISSAWRDASVKSWTEAIGLGPYRVLDAQPGRRMRLVLAPSPKTDQGREQASRFGTGREWALADTVVVRFAPTSAQVRSFMRQDWPDLAWPLPPNLSEDALDVKYRLRMEPARPRRSLKLILRADVPPTTRREARRALAHGIARGEMVRRLGPGVDRRTTWVTGGSTAQPPVLDPDRIREWIERGRLGRSFGVSLAYRSDGPGVAITRQLQEEWSKHSIYVEPKPLPSGRFQAEALTGISHVLIVEHQPMVESVAAEMSGWVMPLRGPAVGPIRTGWRTREFDAGMAAGGPGVSISAAEVRLAEELVVLPLADLEWTWAERAGRPNLPFHPRFGPLISSRSEVPAGRAR